MRRKDPARPHHTSSPQCGAPAPPGLLYPREGAEPPALSLAPLQHGGQANAVLRMRAFGAFKNMRGAFCHEWTPLPPVILIFSVGGYGLEEGGEEKRREEQWGGGGCVTSLGGRCVRQGGMAGRRPWAGGSRSGTWGCSAPPGAGREQAWLHAGAVSVSCAEGAPSAASALLGGLMVRVAPHSVLGWWFRRAHSC